MSLITAIAGVLAALLLIYLLIALLFGEKL
ncbi:MAG: potassium-transporting ATPase subunit F [Myxococcales bacterium]|nr:potassium-transporting ATPase subunit F [Myxococcales bacterium]